MLKRTLTAVTLLATILFCLAPAHGAARKSPSKAQVEQRLDYVVGLRSFSPSQPLSQDRLMKLVLDLAGWGDFPAAYKSDNRAKVVPGCDEYITRAAARRFVRSLVGQDLRIWRPTKDNFLPKMVGDNLGWWFNTGNSMYERPMVHLMGKPSGTNGHLACRFRVTYRWGNLSNNPPNKTVGAGTAVLDRLGNEWIIRSWRIRRNGNWKYTRCE